MGGMKGKVRERGREEEVLRLGVFFWLKFKSILSDINPPTLTELAQHIDQ